MKTNGSAKNLEISGLRTWIEVDRKAVAHNHKLFRSLVGKQVKLMAVVKSNAYGHNLLSFAQEQEKLGSNWLGVDSIVEGLALRKAGIRIPMLVLGYTLPERLDEAATHDISVSISSFEHFRALAKLHTGKKLKVHVKVDTGMHRQGFLFSEMKDVLAHLASKDFKHAAELEGLFTHFASAKNPAFPAYTKKQLTEFNEWRKSLSGKGFSFISHAAATGGAMLFPESHFDMVRIGIGLYGLWPSAETESFLKDRYVLQPVLSWKTVVSEVKKIKKGEKIGYDSTETLFRDSMLAIVPVGYWHGFSRKLSSIGRVLVKGKQCRVLGRVSMDMIIVDVTGVSAKVGDEIVLIGKQGKEYVGAESMANLDETSHYETVTRLNPLIKRLYV